MNDSYQNTRLNRASPTAGQANPRWLCNWSEVVHGNLMIVLALIVAIIARGSMAEDPLEGKNPAISLAHTSASCETSLSVEVSYLLDQDSDPEKAFCSDSRNFPLSIVFESPTKTYIGELALAGLRPYKAGKHGTPILCIRSDKEAVRKCISANL